MRYMVLELRQKNQWRMIDAQLRVIGWFTTGRLRTAWTWRTAFATGWP